MSHVISKLEFGRIHLMFLFLLCSVFASENTFSRKWVHNNMMVFYLLEDHAILFNFLFYDYAPVRHPVEHSYLAICDLQYSEDGHNYTSLMTVQTEFQEIGEMMWIKIRNKKPNENIKFPLFIPPDKRILPPNNIHQMIGAFMTDGRYQDGPSTVSTQNCYLSVKWYLPKPVKSIKTVKMVGYWSIREMGLYSFRIYDVYEVDYAKSNTNTLKNTPSELNSEISNKVKVFGETDAIIVTGAEPGEDIKVYTGSGVEVKSFIANDDVLNIKLPSNQIYIVKAGQARYKVAL